MGRMYASSNPGDPLFVLMAIATPSQRKAMLDKIAFKALVEISKSIKAGNAITHVARAPNASELAPKWKDLYIALGGCP